MRQRRHHLHRPDRRRTHAHRQQGAGDRGGQERQRPDPRVRATQRRPRRADGSSERAGLPALRQGGRRWRWPWHAQGGRGEGPQGRDRHLHARGRGSVRRPHRVHRAGRGRPAPHRGADPRRRRGQRDPPLRARLLGPAAAPEGRRDRAGAQPRPRPPRADVCGRRTVRDRDRLPQRRHRGVPARRGRRLPLHRDEPADPGRAHRDRGGHRRRPRAVPAADRCRRDPGRPRPRPGLDPAARCRAAVPDHHRGPDERLPARHRPDHDVPLPRWRRRPPRRRYDVHRRRGLRPLRLDARQAHLPRAHLRAGGAEGPPGGRRVPDPRRGHQHPVPARPPRRGGLHRGAAEHELHRRPPRPADRSPDRRPRHPAAHLARRDDGEQAARRAAGQRRPGDQAARHRPRRPCPRRLASGPPLAGPGRVRARPARADDASASPTPPSATRTSRCSPPVCAPATCSPSAVTSRG